MQAKEEKTLVTPASVDGQLQALDKGDEAVKRFPPPPLSLPPKKRQIKKNKEKNKEKEKRKEKKGKSQK